MSGGMRSNRALWEAVQCISKTAPRLLIVGGGGYNPWSITRCWARLWATLSGHAPDQVPTATARAVLRELTWSRGQGRSPPEHWFTTIADPRRPGIVRSRIRELVAVTLTPLWGRVRPSLLRGLLRAALRSGLLGSTFLRSRLLGRAALRSSALRSPTALGRGSPCSRRLGDASLASSLTSSLASSLTYGFQIPLHEGSDLLLRNPRPCHRTRE